MRAILDIEPHGKIDGSGFPFQMAFEQSEVFLLNRSLLKLDRKPSLGNLVKGQHQDPRGVHIEAMNFWMDEFALRQLTDAIRHRITLLRATSRDRKETAVLIDHDDVVILVKRSHAHARDDAEKKAKDKCWFLSHNSHQEMGTAHDHLIWHPLGDSAVITTCEDPADLARQLREDRPAACLDVVSSYHHLAVYFQPHDFTLIQCWLKHFPYGNSPSDHRIHRIPIWYDPKWIAELASQLNHPPESIRALHETTTFTVAALGFSPGFPYLTGLPAELHLPRKATPEHLPAGTVAIAANQAGIYPNASFGGWHPLGRTDLPLFNPRTDPPTTLQPGDKVLFEAVSEPISPSPFSKLPLPEKAAVALIESAGPATSLQSSGRSGHRHLGVTPGGSADPAMSAALNLLLGNARGTTCLEFALEAPVLRFLQPCQLAFLGPLHRQAGQVITMREGQILDLRRCPMQSSFGVLAIAGGFAAEEVLGSCATDVRANFGGQILQSGDSLLPANHPPLSQASKHQLRWPLLNSPSQTIRILDGEQADWFTENLSDLTFQKSARFDRTAARLSGPPLTPASTAELTSRPILAGAIQIPPDGSPTVLLPECQTIGGYPVISYVISADLPALIRAKPGTRIQFQKVTLQEARRAWQAAQRELAILETGLTLGT